jgi:hypothetical protein
MPFSFSVAGTAKLLQAVVCKSSSETNASYLYQSSISAAYMRQASSIFETRQYSSV